MELPDQLQETLGPAYTLDRELGGGGMSRVFVATETALARQIVVKVMPPDSAGHMSLERFKREIKLAASLQHPHIVPLLSAGESRGLPFYTMPFVKGESLRERLVKGELSVKDTIHVLHDVASALAYAHREGIVHRDIKPENIILSGGVAVVTDFGVSKALNVATSELSAASEGLTSLGVALGTPAYMSPEQASADPRIDHRADIYAFGCVAYELLVGTSPFAGRTPQQMLAAHMTETPSPVLSRRASVPPALSALVSKCLEKSAGDRPQSADELLAALDAIATPSGGMEPTSARRAIPKPARVRWVAVGVLATVVLVALIAAIPRLTDRGGSLLKPGQVTPVATSPALEMSPAISRDGKLVTYTVGSPGSSRIYLRQIDGQRPVLLSGELDGDHTKPAWSPDGSQIAFEAKGLIYTVPTLGGTPRPFTGSGAEWQRMVLTAGARATLSPSWSPDGTRMAYANAGGIWVKAMDGAPRRILEGQLFHSESWSPDGQALAFVEGVIPNLGNLSASVLRVTRLDGRRTTISDSTHVNLSPVWMPDGRTILYVSNRDGALDVYEQRLDRDLRVDGAPQRITTGLSVRTISVSADGTRLAYDVVRNRSNLWQIPIPATGIASFASAKQITTDNQRIEAFSISHDGQWLAYDSDRSGNADIYKIRIDGGEPLQLTKDAGNDFAPSWSPNNREIAFHSSRSGVRRVYIIGAEGDNERQVTKQGGDVYAPDWSPDGKHLVFMTDFDSDRGDAVITRQPDGSWSVPQRVTAPGDQATWGRWSPDGQLIAYPILLRDAPSALAVQSAESGPARIIVRPDSTAGSVAWATWAHDPNVLYYCTQSLSGRTAFWSVPVTGGTPRLLFRDDDAHRISRFDFATDGKRLFLNFAADESDVYVVELKR